MPVSTKIGVDRLFIAKVLTDDLTETTYGTPIPVIGTTSINLTLNNSVETIYADDGPFETYQQQGDIEFGISLVGLEMETYAEITGASYNPSTGDSYDNKADLSTDWAVGFRTQKANGSYQYVWVFKGKFAKNDLANTTKSASITPAIEDYMYKGVARISDGNWRRRLDSDDPGLPPSWTNDALNSETTGWFSDPDIEITSNAPPTGSIDSITPATTSADVDTTVTDTDSDIKANLRVDVEETASLGTVVATAPITVGTDTANITGLTTATGYTAFIRVDTYDNGNDLELDSDTFTTA